MDTDDAIVGTILNRREMLRLATGSGLGLAFGGLLLKEADAAYQEEARKSVKLVASPAVTEGPFFVDEKLKRSNLLEGTKRETVVQGIPLSLTFTLYRLKDGKFAPLPNAVVDIWQADTKGVYSDVSAPMNHENTSGQNWLRGYQVSDANGIVRFQTIFPGWYMGRTTHIHFKVRQTVAKSATREFTSQLFFDDTLADTIFANAPYHTRDARQVRNRNDMVFTERQADGSRAGEHLMVECKSAPKGKGYSTKFAVALTDDNLRTGGGRRPGGAVGPGGPGGFGGPPPGGPPPGGPGGPPFGPPDF
jgi:protocatechuate 3,4-dioxygenase beta subunit